MKKITILAIAFGFMSISANSQDLKSKRGESFLPEKGDWSIGFDAYGIFQYLGNAFNNSSNIGGPYVNNNIGMMSNGIIVKKYTSATTAYRALANVEFNNFKDTSFSNSQMNLMAGLGKEWRKGKTRLQGYYGADAYLRLSSYKEKNTATDYEYKSGLSIGVGGHGFLGAEYFIFPKLSLSAEYAYWVFVNSNPKSKTTNGSTTVEGNSNTSYGLSGVQTTQININLHF